jgi:hopene-associated glycosyltransferase HpnB
VLFAVAACALAALTWLYLLTGHGGYWRTDQRLPAVATGPAEPAAWPSVVAVVPARDEALILPVTLPTLLAQDYPGEFSVVMVDDDSADGTAQVAAGLASQAAAVRPDPPRHDRGDFSTSIAEKSPRSGKSSRSRAASMGTPDTPGTPATGGSPGRGLRVIAGTATPSGWAGKVWAMAQGLRAAADAGADYVLFTDADIEYQPGTLTALVRAAEDGDRVLVSQMALLRAESGWERVLVPAFVYFFAQLYPFRRVNRGGGRTAAAAGGCMLVRRRALAAAGGLERIRGARIDDVSLGRLLKRRPAAGRCWLGLTTDVRSLREYSRLEQLWDMIARSAYTQLRYSPVALAGTVIGLLWLYLLPPAAALAGLGGLAAGAGALAGWLAVAGLAGWAMMSLSYLPILRLYRLSPLRAPTLPLIALMYAAMTSDSARRHHRGRGGEWKGRTIPASPR